MRVEKQLTQKDIAKQLNISNKTVAAWEQGETLPDILLLVPLANILGITTTELLTCEKLTYTETFTAEQFDSVLKNITDEHKIKTHYEPLKKTNIALVILNSLCFLSFFLFFSFAFYTITNINFVDAAFYPAVGPALSALAIIIIVINIFIAIIAVSFFYKKSFLYIFSISHYIGAAVGTFYFENSLHNMSLESSFNVINFLMPSVIIYFSGIAIAAVLTLFAWLKFYRKNDVL